MMIFSEINKLLLGRWEKIVVQGGKLDQAISSGRYFLSGLWVLRSEQWLEISAVEFDCDEYLLSIGRIGGSPVPDPVKTNNPPRQILTRSPEDCRLDRCTTDGVAQIGADDARLEGAEILVDGALVLKCVSGDVFRVAVSEICLGHIEVQAV